MPTTKQPLGVAPSPWDWRRPVFWLQVATILAAGWFVYAPALRGGWVWDDRADIAGNPLLRTTDGLWKIWFQPALLFDFYPIKYSVQWLQWQAWQEDTLGYHLTNLALHLTSAFLFWRVLRKLGLRHAWLGALLFTVHPVAVESVAWIAELKNTLSLPPLLLAVSAFIDYVEHGRRRDLVLSATWYIIKMLCKTSAAMLPFVLLLYVWWRRGKIERRDLAATLPFFATSLVLGLVTIWFQHYRGVGAETIVVGGWLARLALTGTSLLYYLRLCLWPDTLLPIYPKWPIEPPAPWLFLAWVALAVPLWWMWRQRATWGRHALLGAGCFLIYLLPVTGVITISFMRFSWVMDHIAYVPLLGVVGLAVAAAQAVESRLGARWRSPTIVGVLGLCAGCAVLSRAHAARFAAEEGLWAYTLEHNPAAWMAHNNYGAFLDMKGQRAAARDHYEAALRLNPNYADAHKNFADHLGEAGEVDRAISHYQAALRVRPDFVDAYVNFAELLRSRGRAGDAEPLLRQALHLDLAHADAYQALGLTLRDLGRSAEAVTCFEAALQFRPDFAEAHSNLGSLLRALDRTAEALDHLQAALALRPESFEIRYNLANALQSVGRHEEAVGHYTQVLRVRPNFGAAHYNLGLSLRAVGRETEAREHIEQARQFDPNLPEVRF